MYKITCKKCKQEAVVEIDDHKHLITRWVKFVPIISGRYRLDMQWGWECTCGNDTRLSAQEKKTIKNPVSPDPKDIMTVTKNLQIVPDTRFKMEAI